MRILMIGNVYPTQHQVCAVWMQRIAEQIAVQGHNVELLVIRGRASSAWGRFLQYVVFYARLALKRMSKYDCVYVHQPSHCFLPLLGRSLGRARLTTHLHGTDLLPPTLGVKGRLARMLTLHACRRADLVIVPSEYFARKLLSFISPERLHVYPSGGVDVSAFAPPLLDAPRAGSPLQVGCACRLFPGKGVDTLLEAIALLPVPFCVNVVGDGPERLRLERRAAALRVDGCVKFLGALPGDSMPEYLRSLDVFVFPTRLIESLGLAALEAMGCSVPVIGSRIGALPEYIEHGVNGFLFEPGNARELAEMLRAFSQINDTRRQAMRASARQTAMKYDTKACTCQLLSAFRHLLREAA
ncbi:MAG: glycosyltransferase family 4 protein [Thermoguttaceae bacterium]|jgi:glycosyltransferase involved in cell wall biosynthesis|nr:glycosyltransferase family 4 protein [Thermoguttaceae bacterium]